MNKLTICGLVGKTNKCPKNNVEIIDSSDSFYDNFGFLNKSKERLKKLKR